MALLKPTSVQVIGSVPKRSHTSFKYKVVGAAASLVDMVKSKFKRSSDELVAARRSACEACPGGHWDGAARAGLGKCALCGCCGVKWEFVATKCPEDYWPNPNDYGTGNS